MPLSGSKAARKRLGRLLVQARVEMDVRYKNRALFARERDLNYRLVQDIENAARPNFDDPTKVAIELTYGWQPGSIDRVMAGGEPVKAATAPGADAVLDLITSAWASPDFAPPVVRRIWQNPRFTQADKLGLIQTIIDGGLRNPGNPGEEQERRRA